MGIAYAKDYDRMNFHLPIKRSHPPDQQHQSSDNNALKLEQVRVRVDRVHINGLDRTKDDYVEGAVADLFNADNFQQVLIRSHQVRSRLDNLGCFKNIAIHIDISRGPAATPDGLEVTFDVRELGRLAGSVNTQVSNNEGALVLGFRAPNLFGRGERVQTEYSYGSHNSVNFNVAFSKPFPGKYEPMFTTGVYQANMQWPPSGYKQLDRGLTIGFGFKSASTLKHNILWDGMIRDLSPLGLQTSFNVREQAGLSLKSAIKHIFTMDQRDESVFPTYGNLLQFTTEFAGLGGNVGFIKNELFAQQNFTLFDDFVLQVSQSGGVIQSVNNDLKITMSDMYYLGGALSIRGFETRGIGPHAETNALGSTETLQLCQNKVCMILMGDGELPDSQKVELYNMNTS